MERHYLHLYCSKFVIRKQRFYIVHYITNVLTTKTIPQMYEELGVTGFIYCQILMEWGNVGVIYKCGYHW